MIWMLFLFLMLQLPLLIVFRKPPYPKQKKSYDFILILGCPSHDDGTYSTFQLRRIHAAAHYYKEGYANTIIISGGNVKNKYSEAEEMSVLLKELCPNATILLEKEARNTFQNLKNVKLMMDGDTPLVISGSSHLRRAYFFVKKFYPSACMGSGLEHDPWYAYLWEYTRMWVALYWEVKLKRKEKVS